MTDPINRPSLSFLNDLWLEHQLTNADKFVLHTLLKDLYVECACTLKPSNKTIFKVYQGAISLLLQNSQKSESELFYLFSKNLTPDQIQSLKNPFLKNLFLILFSAQHPLSDLLDKEEDRIDFAYRALHGNNLTRYVLASHLENFEINDQKTKEDLLKKLNKQKISFSE